MSERIQIGSCSFNPVSGTITNGNDIVKLEHRAASLLALLCQNAGDVVLHADIIEKIWDGRSVSSNSIAVVIADIRRALGDDARRPTYIETLSKRGYRMMGAVTKTPNEAEDLPPANQSQSGRAWKAWGALIAAGIVISLALFMRPAPTLERINVSITPIENQTENDEFGVLSKALSELLATEIMRTERFNLTPNEAAQYNIDGKLIMWDGHPALSFHARSHEDQVSIWSGMASGPESKLPSQVRREVGEMTESLDKKRRSEQN